MKHRHIIRSVEDGSIAWELGVEPGDCLISINDKEIEDVFDYHYLVNDEELVILIEKPDGEEWELEIEKDYEEDLGIEFEQGLMDEYRSCRNVCSASSTRCRKECERHFILKMMIPDFPSCREITSR